METRFLVREIFPFRFYLYKPLPTENRDDKTDDAPSIPENSKQKKATTLPSLVALRLFWFAVLTACNTDPILEGYGDAYLPLYSFSLDDFRSQFTTVKGKEGSERIIPKWTIRNAVEELKITRIVSDQFGENFPAFGSEDNEGDSIWIPEENLHADGTRADSSASAFFKMNRIYFTSEFISEEALFYGPEVAEENKDLGIIFDYSFIVNSPRKNARDIITFYPLYLAIDKQFNSGSRNVATSAYHLMTMDGYSRTVPGSMDQLAYSYSNFRSSPFRPTWDTLNDLLGGDIQYDDFRASVKNPKNRCVVFHRHKWNAEKSAKMSQLVPPDLYD